MNTHQIKCDVCGNVCVSRDDWSALNWDDAPPITLRFSAKTGKAESFDICSMECLRQKLSDPPPPTKLNWVPSLKKAFAIAVREAEKANLSYLSTEHVQAGINAVDECLVAENARRLLCCKCNSARATIHLTHAVDNKVQRVDFCEVCAKAHKIPFGKFTLADLLTGIATVEQE